MPSFTRLLERLADSGIEFVIVGGYAAVAHGSTIVTRDLDICAGLTAGNIEALRRALTEFNPRNRMTPRRLSCLDHPKGQSLQNLDLETDAGVLDIMSEITGVGDVARLSEKAERLTMNGREFRVMALDDLIAAKEAIGREKDLLAVKELRAIAAKRKR